MKSQSKLALHSTILSGNTGLVRELLSENVDVNSRDSKRNTPLHIAAIKGYTEIAELLIEKGANVNLKNRYGAIPLHLASQQSNTETAILLINNRSALDAKDRYGETALHFAVMNSNSKLAQHLIDNGCKLNQTNKEFLTPLSIARANGCMDIIKRLENSGAISPKGIMDTIIDTFYSSNIFRKISAIAFIVSAIGGTSLATILTSGKLALSLPLAICASIGFVIVYFNKQYNRVRNLESKVLNGVLSQDEAEQLLFSKNISVKNKNVQDDEFVINEPTNDNNKSSSDADLQKNKDSGDKLSL